MTGLPNGFSNLNAGQIEMDGSAIQLPEFLASAVVLSALKANLDPIYIGPAGVTEATGLEIIPGASVPINVGHTSMIYAIGASGDHLAFLAAF